MDADRVYCFVLNRHEQSWQYRLLFSFYVVYINRVYPLCLLVFAIHSTVGTADLDIVIGFISFVSWTQMIAHFLDTG